MLEMLDTVVLEEFVSHPVMERLNKPVMPWLTGRDKRLNRLILGRPGLEGVGYELRSVIHPDHPRATAVLQTSHVKQFNHRACVDLLVDCEGNVFACVLSMMLQILIILPCQVESNWKSNAHTSPGYWPAGTLR